MSKERRFNHSKVELRAANDKGLRSVVGYAAVYNSPSNPLRASRGEFVEVIEPGFFDGVMNDDVRALFNHDENFILARSNAGKGTLSLFTDERGLGYEFTPPDTTAGRDLAVSLERGDIDASSFAFSIREGGDKWEQRDGNSSARSSRAGARSSTTSRRSRIQPTPTPKSRRDRRPSTNFSTLRRARKNPNSHR